MKPFRRFIGQQLCPRCKSKQLAVVLDGKVRKNGRLSSLTLRVERDTNPACMFDGEIHSLNSEQAQRIIEAAEAKKRLKAGPGLFDPSS